MSFIYPVSTSILSNTYSDISEEEQMRVSENYQDYLDETKEALSSIAPEDFAPDLTKLDALVESLIIYDPNSTTESELTGTIWKLAEVQELNDTILSINDPQKYTLEFLPESQVSVHADCKRGSGRYTQFESLLSIQIINVTQAMCPEDSLSEEFIRYLNEANSYILEEDVLNIALKFDSVLMKFVKSE